jgi:hypothetical protein
MRRKKATVTILFGCLLLAGGFAPPCGAEDYVAKQGVALHRIELQNLAHQILKLDAGDREQREFLDRLFQMKFAEAEKLFYATEEGPEVNRAIGELYLLKALETEAMGNWIQAHFAIQDAAARSPQVMSQNLVVGEKTYSVPAFARDLESKTRQWGNLVRFVIRPFPSDRMFRPEKVVLSRSEEEKAQGAPVNTPNPRSAEPEKASPGGRWETDTKPLERLEISPKDQAYLLERFSKALFAYYYNPIPKNAAFNLFLPHGEYYVYEKDFMIHPVDFEVSEGNTQVVLQPATWFQLTLSDEVHPSNVVLSFHGVEWKDLNHVPFGSYRILVKSNEFTAPVHITFVPKADASSEPGSLRAKGEVVVIEDRGVYNLSLRKRTGNEKLRYSLLGF